MIIILEGDTRELLMFYVYFQKIALFHTSTAEGQRKLQAGRGWEKAKVLKEKYRVKLEFPVGWGWEWGANQKNPSVGGL